MKKIILFGFVLYLFLPGCRLDPPIYPDEVDNGPGTYFQSGTGTILTYQSFLFGQLAGETVQTVTGNTSTENNRLYYEVTTLNGADQDLAYYSKTGGMYSFKNNPLVDDVDGEVEYLRESAAVGESWTKDFPPDEQGQVLRAVCTMKEKGITKTVLGKAYPSVIHTTLQMQVDDGAGFTTQATLEFYVAKNVGIIQIDSQLFGFEVSSQLKSYTIK